MLEELSNMDRITQLQDEIQNASFRFGHVLTGPLADVKRVVR